MLINLVGAFKYFCAIEKYYVRALRELGHKLTVATPVVAHRLPNADLTVVIKWCSFPELLPKPRVLIFTDLTSRFQEYYDDVQKHYDQVFLVHDETLVDNKRVFYLPVAVDFSEHYYVESKKDLDCLFIGTRHPCREFMRKISIITRYGNEWGDTRDVYGDEYRDLCSQAKIIINQHYPLDTTNMRDYESLCYKALVLTDKTPFEINRDVVVYDGDPGVLEQKIYYFLDHEDERRKIAEQGYKTITTGKYTYKDRMEEMLRIIKNNISNINNVSNVNNINNIA